jgi:pimeloyl-ACP methyl ester carboxylesterase
MGARKGRDQRGDASVSDSWKHGFVYTNGIRMHYVEQGEGPLVLLCHGWPESWYSWRHQLPALAAAGFRVVAPDQRGYGLTDAPSAVEAYDIFQLAGDLVGLVHALGETQAVLIGHDWGSILAAPTALMRPDMFWALGLLSVPYLPRQAVRPAVRFRIATQERHFYQEYFQQPDHVERELEEDVRRTLAGILYTASAEGVAANPGAGFAMFEKSTRMVDNLTIPERLPSWLSEDDLTVFVEQFQKSGFRGPTNWYRNFDRNWQLTPFLDGAKIQQPTVFVAGASDGVLRMAAEEFKALEANVSDLRGKHVIPDAGHWVQQEKPEEVNRILLDFLGGLSSPRPAATS